MTKWQDKEAAIRQLERAGKVDPNDLIAAAKDEDHPCHDDFTWDIESAASERWRDQARKIIRRCNFTVMVEDVGTRVAAYVSSPDNDDTFSSLPKLRSKTKVSLVLAAEINMLHGVSSRVYGIALAKQGIVGDGMVAKLGVIRDSVAELVEEE